jgi:opacity protein-like surface antigen
MTRHAAAVAVIACLGSIVFPALPALCAQSTQLQSTQLQSTQFKIGSEPADVHKSPSTGSPVIGQASRGAVLSVTRELGSWVKVSWPAAQDGVGYVHVTMGSIGNGFVAASRPPAGATTTLTPTPARQAPAVPSAPAAGAQGERTRAVAQPSPVRSVPIPHMVGLGGRMGGSTLGFGASARALVGGRFRVQLEASRYAHTSGVTQRRLTSVQFAPSLLYSLPDKVTDYLWIRPHLGAGFTVYRSTSSGISTASDSVSDNRLGRQAFGGAEVAVAGVPRFTLSADFGYRWAQTPFDGVALGGRSLSVAGHWYVK